MPGMVLCCYCLERGIEREVEGNYREVIGWEKRRRGKHARGGLHALVGRHNTGRHACDSCGFDLTHGIAPGSQRRLFDA